MSSEETRESASSGAITSTADSAPTETPKPVRRRRTTKKEENTDEVAAHGAETSSVAGVKPAKTTTRKTVKRTAQRQTTVSEAPAAVELVASGSVATAPTAAERLAPAAVQAPATTAPVPGPSAVEPAAPAIVNPSLVTRHPVAVEGTTPAENRFENRFASRNNASQENGFQNRDNNNQRGESQRGEIVAPAPLQDGNEGANSANDRPFEGDRNFDNRMRFSRGGRNQLRRERGNGRNGRFGGPNGGENGAFNPQPRRREVEILALQGMERPELETVAVEFSIETLPQENEAAIYAILEAQAHSQNAILKRGTLEILPDGKGFLRCEGYLPADGDVYVSQSQIKRFNLKTGDLVLGTVRTPKEMERFHGLLRVEAINGLSPEVMKTRKDFEKLTPIFPEEKFVLETEPTNITARIIDLVSPIGKGSRGLIVAPPKAGKTTLIKNIANSIAQNHPDVVLIVLLIDERPEEVTDISRSIKGEVVASTFDEMPDNHMRVADIVMEKAKRLVEMKRDVVILMDSITRLSRASNLVVTPSGRTLSGGLDPAAMYRPKRMFGAARNIEEGGSLTILATALVDTGSRMDEMIFEEFKGTGNLDLVLDRNLFDQRIFPAIDINRSGTRRDDLLLGKEDLATVYHLRRTLAQLDNDKAVTLLIDRLKNTKSNLDFMNVVAKSARNTGQGAG